MSVHRMKKGNLVRGCLFLLMLVRLTGLEPAHREILDPKSSASTNSATGALYVPLRSVDTWTRTKDPHHVKVIL